MRHRVAAALVGLAAALALATPAEAAEGNAASPTSTVVIAGPATTLPDVDDDDDDDDSDKTGLWGLLGLAGLAGLAGLRRRHDAPTGGTRVNADTTPRGSTAR